MNNVCRFKVNKIDRCFLEELKRLEKDGYITQVIDSNRDIEVGDIRFCIYEGVGHSKKIVELTLHKITMKSTGKFYTFKGSIKGYTKTITFRESSFGKKVFLTKDDVENALRK